MRQRLTKLLKSSDKFGQPVALNFQGEAHFKTTCGGMITFLSCAFFVCMTLVALLELISKGNSVIKTYEIGDASQPGSQNLLKNKLQITFMLLGSADDFIDPRAGRLEYAYKTQLANNDAQMSGFTPLQQCA